MSATPPYEKIRMAGLTALYGALAALSLLLGFATFSIWPALEGNGSSPMVISLAFSCALMFLSNGRAAFRFAQLIRSHKHAPASMLPFGFSAVTLYLSSKVFTAL